MNPRQLAEVITATSQNYEMPPVVSHNMELTPLDQQVLSQTANGQGEQAFADSFGVPVQEPNIQVRVSFPASVYGKNAQTGSYELQRVETARDLGEVALDRAGIAIASSESYMNLDAQGAMKSAQAAHLARQDQEMFRQVSQLFDLDLDGKKKKKKRNNFELNA